MRGLLFDMVMDMQSLYLIGEFDELAKTIQDSALEMENMVIFVEEHSLLVRDRNTNMV